MRIRNLNGLTMADLHDELVAGGRFVTYQYCISFLLFSFCPTSDVYFVPSGKTGFRQSVPYTLTSLLFGWWGLPWGPMHTIAATRNNLQGGTDVTETVVAVLASRQLVSRQSIGLSLQAAA